MTTMKKPFPKSKSAEALSTPDASTEEPVEVPASDGFTELDTEDTQESNDPLPSAPVQEPIVPIAPETERIGVLPYLGTLIPSGMVGRGGSPQAASMVAVVRSKGVVLGVVVLSDPGMASGLDTVLGQAGYVGPFDVKFAHQMDRATKLAVARAIARQNDPLVDRVGVLASVGFTPEMLAS